jgi:hypothetical protein
MCPACSRGTFDRVNSYWPFLDLPNFHFFHFAEMKSGLHANIKRIADAVNIPVSASDLDAMTEAATFENMQRKGEQFAPEVGTGMWKKDSSFFANGKSGRWKNRLSNEQLAAFDTKIREFLSSEQLTWLLHS